MADYVSCKSAVLSSIEGSCDSATGGIKRVLIANRADVKTVTVDPLSEVITDIQMNDTKKFAQWTFRREKGSFTTTTTDNNGNESTASEITLVFTRMEAVKRLNIKTAINAGAVMIVEANDGTYWYFGYDYPLQFSTVAGSTGTALADQNEYTLTISDASFEMVHTVDSTIIDGLLTA